MFLKTDGAGNLSFASLSFATPLTVIGNSTAGSSIRLPEDTDNGSNYVALKAPDSLSSDLTFTLPSADGTSGQVLQTNGSGVLSFVSGGGKFESALLHVRDEKTANTYGGTPSGIGSFLTRTLNTVMTNEISGASLSSNQITLPSGTYFIYARIPTMNSGRNKSKLRNTSDSSDALIGSSTQALDTGAICEDSWIIGRFTIASSKTFEIQNRVEYANSNSFGLASNFGVVEVYTDVQIWKVA